MRETDAQKPSGARAMSIPSGRRHRVLRLLILTTLLASGLPTWSESQAQSQTGAERPTRATIVSPAANAVISNVHAGGSPLVETRCSIVSAASRNWIIEIGSRPAAAGWTVLGTGTTDASGEILLKWNAAHFPNGPYTLRLVVGSEQDHPLIATTNLEIANFSMSQDVLQIDSRASSHVTYLSEVPFSLHQLITIRNLQGAVVRHLVDEHREAGEYRDMWDAHSDGGERVPDGPYFYSATVRTERHAMVFDLSGEFLDNFFDSQDGLPMSDFDPFANRPLEVKYSTSLAGLTTISLFNRGVLGHDCEQPRDKVICLVDRRYEPAGDHTFTWAGVDSNDAYVASAFSNISITSTRERFARNAVIVFGTAPSVLDLRVDLPSFSPPIGRTRLAFRLASPIGATSDISIRFVNLVSHSTLRTVLLPTREPSQIEIEWDGRADNGALVAPGPYLITVTAADRIGNTASARILATVRR